MANQDFNFDGVIDAFDDYAMHITCVDWQFIPDPQDRALYCSDYQLTSPKLTEFISIYQIDIITPYFPKGLPINAIDEGQGLGYYVYDNQCFTAWGSECIPQQQSHFLATYVEPDPPPVNVVGGLTQVHAYEILGVVLALFIAYLWIRVFALRGAHA